MNRRAALIVALLVVLFVGLAAAFYSQRDTLPVCGDADKAGQSTDPGLAEHCWKR